MAIPTTVTFHGLKRSEALEAAVFEYVNRLEHFADDIVSCRVVITSVERRHHQGNRFNVHMHLSMHGREIEAGHTPTPDSTHEDPYVALSQTFDALRRRVEDYVRHRRGDIKSHAQRPSNFDR